MQQRRVSSQRDASADTAERDAIIRELRETNEVRRRLAAHRAHALHLMRPISVSQILDAKVQKLEQLVRLKDAKIAALLSKLQI